MKSTVVDDVGIDKHQAQVRDAWREKGREEGREEGKEGRREEM